MCEQREGMLLYDCLEKETVFKFDFVWSDREEAYWKRHILKSRAEYL